MQKKLCLAVVMIMVAFSCKRRKKMFGAEMGAGEIGIK